MFDFQQQWPKGYHIGACILVVSIFKILPRCSVLVHNEGVVFQQGVFFKQGITL